MNLNRKEKWTNPTTFFKTKTAPIFQKKFEPTIPKDKI